MFNSGFNPSIMNAYFIFQQNKLTRDSQNIKSKVQTVVATKQQTVYTKVVFFCSPADSASAYSYSTVNDTQDYGCYY